MIDLIDFLQNEMIHSTEAPLALDNIVISYYSRDKGGEGMFAWCAKHKVTDKHIPAKELKKYITINDDGITHFERPPELLFYIEFVSENLYRDEMFLEAEPLVLTFAELITMNNLLLISNNTTTHPAITPTLKEPAHKYSYDLTITPAYIVEDIQYDTLEEAMHHVFLKMKN
jgi:hypothetical protein